jgi:hypothetical protein
LGRILSTDDKYSPYTKIFKYAVENDIFEYEDGGEPDILLYNNDKKIFYQGRTWGDYTKGKF